jgi:hypothetical protein
MQDVVNMVILWSEQTTKVHNMMIPWRQEKRNYAHSIALPCKKKSHLDDHVQTLIQARRWPRSLP